MFGTIVISIFYMLISTSMGNHAMSLLAVVLCGSLVGFLLFNWKPAKVFMGDTGSMYLGGAFVAIGLTTHKHLLMVLVGLVYILEALSVVIQVTYFKITARQHYKKTGEKGKGKRIFKMSPIHHHFEMCGFSEYKIVIMFSIAAIIVSALGVLTVI